jgi:hypothetical protein
MSSYNNFGSHLVISSMFISICNNFLRWTIKIDPCHGSLTWNIISWSWTPQKQGNLVHCHIWAPQKKSIPTTNKSAPCQGPILVDQCLSHDGVGSWKSSLASSPLCPMLLANDNQPPYKLDYSRWNLSIILPAKKLNRKKIYQLLAT